MSIELDMGTLPEGTIAVTSWDGSSVDVGDITIAMADFCHLVLHVITNSDLQPEDPRFDLFSQLAQLKILDGFMPGRKRLGYPSE